MHVQDKKSTVAGVKRAQVFFDIAPFGDHPGGRIVFELYNDITAATAENFRQLATCEHGMGTDGKPLCYKGVPCLIIRKSSSWSSHTNGRSKL